MRKILIYINIISTIEAIVNYFNQYFVNIQHTLAPKPNEVERDSHKKILKPIF